MLPGIIFIPVVITTNGTPRASKADLHPSIVFAGTIHKPDVIIVGYFEITVDSCGTTWTYTSVVTRGGAATAGTTIFAWVNRAWVVT